jgi:hypothetical protein
VDQTKSGKALRHDDPALIGRGVLPAAPRWRPFDELSRRLDRHAPAMFVMPAVLVVLAMSIFPLIVSLYLSLARFRFVKGGFEFKFVGLFNYAKLLFGSEQFHFLGEFGQPGGGAWAVLRSPCSRCWHAPREPAISLFSVCSHARWWRRSPGAACC